MSIYKSLAVFSLVLVVVMKGVKHSQILGIGLSLEFDIIRSYLLLKVPLKFCKLNPLIILKVKMIFDSRWKDLFCL